MMEVKQNTAVDLNELLTSSKNSGTDEVDDAVMTDLTDGTHDLVNCDLIKTNDIGNGDVAMASLIDEVDVAADLNNTVNSELEDALLAEDDVLPKITNAKIVEPNSTANEDDILADKVETSNSTTSSSNVRDPGDDLDTLLSKINDIVEDCIDNESETVEQQEINKIIDTKSENNLNESVIFVKETHTVNEEKENVKDNEAESSNNNDESILNQSEIDEFDQHRDISLAVKETSNKQDSAKELVTEKRKEEGAKLDADNVETNTKVMVEESAPENIINNALENQNENLHKTEKKEDEATAEAVQDNEITSNSNEISNEDVVDKTVSSPKVSDTKEEIEEAKDQCNDKVTKQVTEQPKEESKEDVNVPDSKVVENVEHENEDSDDEIVFYVDKPPEIVKPNETETKSNEVESERTSATKNEEKSSTAEKKTETPVKKSDEEDDDVVLLLDDEDEDVGVSKKLESNTNKINQNPDEMIKVSEETKASTDLSAAKESKDIDVDNSDNARDDFVSEQNVNEKEKLEGKPPVVAETPEETNSNCSSSSNLLQEATSAKTGLDEPTPEEAENEEEEDDGDVELIESEVKETETSEKLEDTELAPPAKRIRLSVDSETTSKTEESNTESKDVSATSVVVEKNQETKLTTENNKTNESVSTLKRSHDVIEVEADEESTASNTTSEGFHKKAKTDCVKTVEESEKKGDELATDLKTEIDDKKDIKAIPSHKPIPLYPAPKFESLKSEPSISLDFLKKFRKSFDNMTKQDLEELVLQKVVEAIIHKSEFSEMRELIEKQEKLITAHRSKISELSKQFRDLEMVHNRVVKDIEQRNSQFIMPVKITRAVGLQVYIPNKKTMTETASSSSTGTGPNVPSSPQRPVSSQASSSSSTSLTSPQRQYMTSQTETQQQQQRLGTSAAVSVQVGAGGNVRRGCVQKITPIRPVPGANQTTSAGPAAAAAAYRNAPNHAAAGQPRILNKNVGAPVNPTAIQRSRFVATNQDGSQRVVVQPQQQISRTTNMSANSQRVTPTTAQPKAPNSVAAALQRRSEPLPPAAAASSTSSIVDNYINTLTHLTGGNTAVSITPAKPKEKAVIDLTDEDETPATQMSNAQVQRRSLPTQNTTNSQLQYGRAAPPLARIPPNANQMVNNNKRQLSTMQAQKTNSFTGISTPPGTSITRINIPQNTTNVQRVKYSHPAPLPATPPQAFNPSWKLPPPRPTIRISNLDNGIVISWTMEESMDRHAECVSYQIYAYQETSGPPMVDSWRHVGDVKAMLLPMAVTLTQFQEGQRYYFAVRAVDCHQRYGPFSLPKTWS